MFIYALIEIHENLQTFHKNQHFSQAGTDRRFVSDTQIDRHNGKACKQADRQGGRQTDRLTEMDRQTLTYTEITHPKP